MFWIIMFVGSGGLYLTVDRFLTPPMIISCVVGLVGAFALNGIIWFNDHTGISHAIMGSLRLLSGQNVVGTIYPESCDNYNLLGNLVLFALVLAHVAIGLTAVIAVPVGLVITISGTVHTFYWRLSEMDVLKRGAMILTVGVGAVILAGLNLRLMHWLAYSWACPVN